MMSRVAPARHGWTGAAASPVAVVGALLVFAFLAAPWSIQHKAHMALHGLCAQRPSHSYWIGEARLPLDARMTGIYVGFAAAAAALVAVDGYRRSGVPPRRWLVAGAALIGAMAIDGTNSLLLDMGRWHPYEPANWLRVATGAGTGIALAAMLCHLTAISLWRSSDRSRFVVTGAREAAALGLAPVAPLLLVTNGPGWLYGPVAVLLVVAALSVLSSLALVCLVVARRLDWTFAGVRDAQPVAAQAVLVGAVAMGVLSASRLVFERLVGASPLT